MTDGNKSLRIDWFDGSVIEDRSSTAPNSARFEDEEQPAIQAEKPQYERKPIGFKRLLDISLMKPPILTLEVSNRPGFWNLLENELKGDFIVLIVRVLANIYNDLDRSDRSKIVRMLQTRFLKSIFPKTLEVYMSELPSVRIVEKRMNSQLWDDVESFYFDVLSVCNGIYRLSDGHTDDIKCINNLLEALQGSAIGVCQEHRERLSKNLFEKIEELQLKLNNHYVEDLYNGSLVQMPTEPINTDVNYFKNLQIIPTREDLLGQKDLNIKPNIINGSYPDIKSYLDLQFKLLREDYFGPLREGICKYLENPSKRRHENIRVHPKVRIIRTYVSNKKVGHLVDIAWKERSNHALKDYKKYCYNKQLMYGSLLLFTSDNFETILCATVLDSNLDLLSEGYIAAAFQNPVSKNIFDKPYVMVESEVFFEPYHRVLKVLQTSRTDELPMQRYIVDVQTVTQPPSYLTSETHYTIQDPDNRAEIAFPVLATDQWPDIAAFGLDQSQMEAYKFALTREFAVIQGPPGTGKTFIGIKIASTLLKNLSLEGTPMLIICYTNHALDQFLEGILDVTENIVRLGSQSKSKILEPYSLNNMRARMKSRYSHSYASKRSELENIFKQMTDVQTEIEKCEKELLAYKSLKPFLKVEEKIHELKSSKEDPVLNWLFGHLEPEMEDSEEEDDWEKQFDDVNISDDPTDNLADDCVSNTDQVTIDKLQTCFNEEWALKEMDSMRNSIKYVKDVTDDHCEGQKMADKFEAQILKVRRRLNCFKKYMSAQNETLPIKEYFQKSGDLYSLPTEQRWLVYFAAVRNIKDELLFKMNSLLEQNNVISAELEEVATLVDGEVMKTARVVGVTTTTAARRHDLMRRLQSPIVIIEEAAEVLEAHIVASLTNRCQHVILIGDHRQLRPTAAHYKLAKNYNLEISLFERMIRNGVHARTLTIQRRMRPNFAELLVPTIYEKLDCHPIVYNYPDVKGMKKNFYFYSHDVFEDSEGMEDSWSHRNTLEAKWCVALADYLRVHYDEQEITILATYNGQANLIKQLSKKYRTLRDVKTTVVDNYQGEENRIVILSLVRSNRDGKIGFLTAANRICVALSRAKEGFYIFGNMNVLKSSSIWRHIHDKLVAQEAIGKTITLRCELHKDNTYEVTNFENLEGCLSGKCLKFCEQK